MAIKRHGTLLFLNCTGNKRVVKNVTQPSNNPYFVSCSEDVHEINRFVTITFCCRLYVFVNTSIKVHFSHHIDIRKYQCNVKMEFCIFPLNTIARRVILSSICTLLIVKVNYLFHSCNFTGTGKSF